MTEKLQLTWDQLKKASFRSLEKRGLDGIYQKRLRFELDQIELQGTNQYWLNTVTEHKQFSSNPSQLLLPWLFNLVKSDPIAASNGKTVSSANYNIIMKMLSSTGKLPPGIYQDQDKPDIDIDCLPEARDKIKDYAAQQYGAKINDDYGAVCSVATWMTYKLRSAIIDVAAATEICTKTEAIKLTKELPDEVDDLHDNGASICKGKVLDKSNNQEKDCSTTHAEAKCPNCGSSDAETPTIGRLLQEHELLRVFHRDYPEVINYAVRLVGRIRTMGKHAGALIITDRPLFGNIPMAYDSNAGHWKSLWTEGRSTQLSKLGYTKWDILGLKNLRYICECSWLIEKNHGISFGEKTNIRLETSDGKEVGVPSMTGWDDINPEDDRAGHYFDKNGNKTKIELNDKKALRLASESKTDAVFQFDTDLAKRTLKHGVKSFNDLVVLMAMGHPGPMDSIPDYVKRRDDPKQSWKKQEHPKIVELLEKTYGVICFQEQLASLWQNIADFTATEAQEARKAVAKKWQDKLKPVRQKWIDGASKLLGVEVATMWWDERMAPFGRYAFNMSHGVAYCLVAHRCLWLKAHFPEEWWAAVMSYCDQDKLVRYTNVARNEGAVFLPIDIGHMTVNFTAVPDSPRLTHLEPSNGYIVPGLISMKGVGEKAAQTFAGTGQYESIDDFVAKRGRHKILLERLIKLGAFKKLPGHENSQAVWIWYQFKYCSGTDITKLKQNIGDQVLELESWKASGAWNQHLIELERQKQAEEFKNVYPKRKVPAKIENWYPKPIVTLEKIVRIYTNDFKVNELLNFEEEFLGYHVHSPLAVYRTKGNGTIAEAKTDGKLEAVITGVSVSRTKTDKLMCRLALTDGQQIATLILWQDSYLGTDKSILKKGVGIRAIVNYDANHDSFTLQRTCHLIKLSRIDDPNETHK